MTVFVLFLSGLLCDLKLIKKMWLHIKFILVGNIIQKQSEINGKAFVCYIMKKQTNLQTDCPNDSIF